MGDNSSDEKWVTPTKEELQEMEFYDKVASRAAEKTAAERRVHKRTPFAAEITVNSATNFFMGFSEDISEGGLFLSTMSPPPIGEKVTLEVKVGEEVISVEGEVRWHREVADTVTGCGVQFLSLRPDIKRKFEQVLVSLKKEPLFFET